MRTGRPASALLWQKSSYSGNEDGHACVEVAIGGASTVAVRDSKDPEGSVLTFTPAAWADFLSAVREGTL
ncbi:DUF397 domain-containing protein [Actinacidiphila rubida]|uniref:DUF397 domain-containing protein n=1 Tax=Actinacidiphila rubida TaxID=310780 RepID=UPI000849DBAA|nr:DUF397 domain-containing protein [Actinacidiphila rubida]